MLDFLYNDELLYFPKYLTNIALTMRNFDYCKLKMKGYLFYGLAVTFIFAFLLLANNYVNGEAMIQVGIIHLQTWMALPLFIIAWASIFNLPTIKLWKVIVLFIVSVICYLNIAHYPLFSFIYFLSA